MSSNKKITEIFRAVAEGVNAVTGSYTFVLHWENSSVIVYCVTVCFDSRFLIKRRYLNLSY